MGNLDVKIPPDILNDDSPDGGVAPENGSVRLRCKATGIPEPTVMWRREDNKNIILRYDGGREKQGMSWAPTIFQYTTLNYIQFSFEY